MTEEELRSLKRGDIVRNRLSLDSFVVDANYGVRVTAVNTADLTNPAEWEVVSRAILLTQSQINSLK